MMIDHNYMRKKNLSLIFDTMKANDDLYTKRELQKATKLAWATISKSINELQTKEFITEIMEEEVTETADVGRPAKKYDINSKKNLMIGIDINVDTIQAVVIDVKCRVLYSRSSMVFNPERENMLALSKIMVGDIIKEFGDDKSIFLGIGFSLMSVVDAKNGIAVYSQHIKNWTNVDVKHIFESEFGLPVLIEHDPNCYAIAEMNIGIGKKYKNICFLRINFGIGMSLIINGEIYKGNSGSSGEFGHMCMDIDGPHCSCGKKGCVEAYASISGIAARYREDANNTPGYEGITDSTADSDMAIMQKITKAAKSGDSLAQSYFDSAAKMLGLSISNLITLMNPDVVIIGGMFSEYSSLYLGKTVETVNETCWPYSKVNIELSSLESNAAAIGGAALFIQKSAWEDVF